MPIASVEDLLAYELRSIEDAERQAAGALKSLRGQASDDEVQAMLDRRLEEGARILQQVEASLKSFGGKVEAENAAVRGLIAEAQKLVGEIESPEMKDAALIAATQKLEHYCIASWGTVRALAEELGQDELAREMHRAVEDGKAWDEDMSDLAESVINPEAVEASAEQG